MSRIRISIVTPVVSGAGIQAAADLVTKINVDFLLSHPETPLLYESGVRYQEEPPGQEEFCTIPDVLRRGWGDCDDLGPWRAAELQVMGYYATPRVWRVSGGLWHVDVDRGGWIEDPSWLLGM